MGLGLLQARRWLRAEERALLLHSPRNLLKAKAREWDFQKRALSQAMSKRLGDLHGSLSLLEKGMKDLSPLSILKRGYSITRKLPEREVLREAAGVQRGDQVQVLLARGELGCLVENVKDG
jgi:exodeoxyribonuclease VII large subunit